MDRAIIVGAGGAGQELLAEIRKDAFRSCQYLLIGFVDDDPTKWGTTVLDLPVLGRIDDLPHILSVHAVSTVFIAIPSTAGQTLRRIVSQCSSHPVRVRIVPRLSEIIHGTVDLAHVREVQVEDLLGRAVVRQDFAAATDRMREQSVMVFGAAGSIGSELCAQIVGLNPRRLVCVDWSENGIFELQHRLQRVVAESDGLLLTDIHCVIGSILDEAKLDALCTRFAPNVLFHAAAYKHVPLMEENPCEAVLNNILGTRNIFDLATRHAPVQVVLISSDKAVNPTSIMGATKRVAEKLMHCYAADHLGVAFSAVRFGNVLNSSGSVIPTFRRQIQEGIVTVTHPDIVRYFMTVQEAVQLVLQCWLLGGHDEVFVLDMGEPVKILDLANLMIRLSGFEPNRDVQIRYTGLRPGEKLYEEPLTRVEETTATLNDKVFIVRQDEAFDQQVFLASVQRLIRECQTHNATPLDIRQAIRCLVPTFRESI